MLQYYRKVKAAFVHPYETTGKPILSYSTSSAIWKVDRLITVSELNNNKLHVEFIFLLKKR
jgi:hypothetical protein